MAKKEIHEDIQALRDVLAKGLAVIGKETVLKKLKAGSLEKVFLASNTPDDFKDDIEHYAHLANTTVLIIPRSNKELGVLCKKNFFVGVVGALSQ